MNTQIMWKGDYINSRHAADGEWDYITVVEFLDNDDGKLKAKVIRENETPFKQSWQPMSLRGYHQCAEIPEGLRFDMEGAGEFWNARFPENGAVFLFKTKEERDSFLKD